MYQVETAELVNRLKLVSLLTAEALYDLWVRPKLQAINGIKKKKIIEVLVSKNKLFFLWWSHNLGII